MHVHKIGKRFVFVATGLAHGVDNPVFDAARSVRPERAELRIVFRNAAEEGNHTFLHKVFLVAAHQKELPANCFHGVFVAAEQNPRSGNVAVGVEFHKFFVGEDFKFLHYFPNFSCLAFSNITMPAATPALRLLSFPYCGMEITPSDSSLVRRLTPSPSLPMTIATSPVRLAL